MDKFSPLSLFSLPHFPPALPLFLPSFHQHATFAGVGCSFHFESLALLASQSPPSPLKQLPLLVHWMLGYSRLSLPHLLLMIPKCLSPAQLLPLNFTFILTCSHIISIWCLTAPHIPHAQNWPVLLHVPSLPYAQSTELKNLGLPLTLKILLYERGQQIRVGKRGFRGSAG